MLNYIENLLYDTSKIISGPDDILIKRKSKSQYVTNIDLEVEKYLVESIKNTYPGTGIVSEELGLIRSSKNNYFIIDPLDGTSNYMNGLDWYGVMIAFFSNNKIVNSGIYLPNSKSMYLAKLDEGAYRNGKKFKNTDKKPINRSLISFCVDNTDNNFSFGFKKNLYEKCLKNFLNVRSTNSALDYAYACEGKISLVNLENRLWDIAAVSLIARESGSLITDYKGYDLKIDLDLDRNYSIVISDKIKHKKIIKFIND